jgi:asparagine synthase (glutamine-hydrolysing)
MCGLAGAVSLGSRPLAASRLKPMVDALAHRGPDDSGFLVWQTGRLHPRGLSFGQAFAESRFQAISPLLPLIDSPAGQERLAEDPWDIFLGHRRLAILDLSPRGHQPMSNKSQTVWVAYNGEIYNFRELRRDLEGRGHSFVSRSDTEVLLRAYEEWGLDAVHRLNGMFAFALWDGRRNVLHLVRDRYGIKPLYYMEADGVLLFASELKAILEYLPARPGVDLLALNEYFSFQNIFSDRTLLEGLRLLPAGHTLSVDLASGRLDRRRWWDFDFSAETRDSEAQIQERLQQLIRQSVKRQCVSDVPVGSYLSGGMDSSALTAITTEVFGRIFTFTLGFDLSEAAEHEQNFDERELAEHMANLLKTEHYECVLHSGDMEAVLDPLVWHLEDLRAGQCYPNYYVARLAGKFVKVVMSGTGGDELFGGYPWRYAAAVGKDSVDFARNYYNYWQRLVNDEEKGALFQPDVAARLGDLAGGGKAAFGAHSLEVFRSVFGRPIRPQTKAEQINLALLFECKTFLHGLLVVEDKLSMAHGLETRVPFLDNELVDYACRIPIRYKVPGLKSAEGIDENMPRKKAYYQSVIRKGKDVLRQAMRRILPREVTRARKQGFSAPDESWFRGSAEPYIRSVLLAPDARLRAFLNPDFVRRTVDLHCSGQANKRLLIWSFLCFEKWLRRFMGA